MGLYYIGIIFPYSLLTTSMFRGNVKGVETRVEFPNKVEVSLRPL